MPKTISTLSFSEQQHIGQWLAADGTPQQVALRGRIVMAAAEGQSGERHRQAVGYQSQDGPIVAHPIRRARAAELVGSRAGARAQAPHRGSGHAKQPSGNDAMELSPDGEKPKG